MKKLLVLLLIVVGMTSCANPLLEPSIKMHETVHQDYLKYLEKDDSLSDTSKRIRKQSVETYKLLLDEVGKAK